jgi:hypothetical protein
MIFARLDWCLAGWHWWAMQPRRHGRILALASPRLPQKHRRWQKRCVDEHGTEYEFGIPPPLVRKELIAQMRAEAETLLPPTSASMWKRRLHDTKQNYSAGGQYVIHRQPPTMARRLPGCSAISSMASPLA